MVEWMSECLGSGLQREQMKDSMKSKWLTKQMNHKYNDNDARFFLFLNILKFLLEKKREL